MNTRKSSLADVNPILKTPTDWDSIFQSDLPAQATDDSTIAFSDNETPGGNIMLKSVTIVIPCMNEEGNLEKLFDYIDQAFLDIGVVLPVVLIDDGSTDGTPQVLAKLCQKYSFLSVLYHPKNLGVAAVWQTAIDHVKTDWILWSQADLESDPRSDIPALLRAYRPGVDAIAGWRQGRGDGKNAASSLANRACHWAFNLQIHDMNWIKLVRRDLLSYLPIELITHRYLLAVLARQGHNVIETPTPWHPRFSGNSKFGRKRLFTSAIDFFRVLAWFYILQPIELALNYIDAAIDAVQVGFSVARQTFQAKNKSISNSKAKASPQFSTDRNIAFADSTVANIAYYRKIALSKIAV